MNKNTIITGFLLIFSCTIFAQEKIVDQIVGIVGKHEVSYSDIEDQYFQMQAQRMKTDENTKCLLFEDMLVQKLMVNQAEIDSLEVSDIEVNIELNQRIKFFVNQIGSEEKLVEYFGKSILEIKEDMRDAIKEQIIVQQMQGEITSNLSISPAEVKAFYKTIPEDSIPYINAEIELEQIVVYPTTSEEAIYEVRQKLLNLRERINNGERFATLAALYSEGPTAARGGDIGWASKADLDPAYAKVAFSLKKNQVSKIVESSFGYHIIQLIERTEERVHTRHILMKPKISAEEKLNAQARLDSIVELVRIDTFTFNEAALLLSQDEDTRMSGGIRVNPQTGNTKFELDQFDTKEYYVLRDLKIGEISEPFEALDKRNKTCYKVVRIKSRSNPRRANLKEDYDLIKQMALMKKQGEVIDEWIREKIKTTYSKIYEPYKSCSFKYSGWGE